MTSLAYYPGCSLKRFASGCEIAGLEAARRLGIELVELERWNCCGTVFSMSSGERMHHLGSLRNLVRVQEAGYPEVVTMCAMCQNTLRQVNNEVRGDGDSLAMMNRFMDEEPAYRGEVEVLHYLTLLDRLGSEAIAARVERPLTGLRVAPYYGCTLVRPPSAGIDDPEDPNIMERLLEALGAKVVRDPMRVECCGAYMGVSKPGTINVRASAIHGSARNSGAEALATMCPLCAHNLDAVGPAPDEPALVVFYFTQLVALALGAKPEQCLAATQRVDPRPLLSTKGLLEEPQP
ncbi:MAG: CoB--CoM heterodisulfide reductase iron-sulfur subunit B family protein [Gammaproteobacteria bacterium]|nr:CoB--CoM heterodisulfide reductase iron-sulfur subunit B family protein [Gammaproteobacteria bacterium]